MQEHTNIAVELHKWEHNHNTLIISLKVEGGKVLPISTDFEKEILFIAE
ncbi:MAG: hypothetical protein H7A36_03730 [Chlamydiales bacterium]|nr:hypothetical protein [Chlamydiales bacterium]